MGPYCRFCDRRCFVPFPPFTPRKAIRAYLAGVSIIATCPEGQAFERKINGGWCLDAINATRNARFWTFYRNGYVKITLRPDQSLSTYRWERTDEGHSWESNTWRHDGEFVTHEFADGGRDCDGPIRRGGSTFCPLDRLAAVPVYCPEDPAFESTARRPDWQQGTPTEVHDPVAEAAGY